MLARRGRPSPLDESARRARYVLCSVPLSRCAELCGLGRHEMIPGAIPSPFHQSLYESYLMLCDRGADFVRDLIVSDMRRALDIGATRLASELLLVLRRFLSVPRGAALPGGGAGRDRDRSRARRRRAPRGATRVERHVQRHVESRATRGPGAGPIERCDRSATVGGLSRVALRLGLRRAAFRVQRERAF